MTDDRIAWLDALLRRKEGERLEFKQAAHQYDQGKLEEYCCALANEGGGYLLLGITETPTPHVTSTQAFPQYEKVIHHLIQILRLKVTAEEILHPKGRVLVFTVPSHPLGIPISLNGKFLMRGGDSVLAMTPDQVKRILDEAGPDYSAQPVPGPTMADLLPEAIEEFRQRWVRKSGNTHLTTLSAEQLLADAELLIGGQLTIAALVLFGSRNALGRHLGQAEVIFEYRSTEVAGPASQRLEFRQGFFSFYEELWNRINTRNDIQHFQDGLFILDLPTFNEKVIREAILNAISHRDYRLPGSVMIRQYPLRIEIVSPGGFPDGITVDNVLTSQHPRNRRLAEAFSKCGLVERSGQGFDVIYRECIRESRPKPDFRGTGSHQVSLTLSGEIQNPRFLQFLEKIGAETQRSFSLPDLMIIDQVFRGLPVPAEDRPRARALIDQGILERAEGRRGGFILSRKFHAFLGEKGVYTRRKGLDRETCKALLMKHVRENASQGARFEEFAQVLPHLSRNQIQKLLRDLKREGVIKVLHRTRAARWYPVRAGG